MILSLSISVSTKYFRDLRTVFRKPASVRSLSSSVTRPGIILASDGVVSLMVLVDYLRKPFMLVDLSLIWSGLLLWAVGGVGDCS